MRTDKHGQRFPNSMPTNKQDILVKYVLWWGAWIIVAKAVTKLFI